MTTIDAPQPDSRSVIRTTAATTAFVVGWYALPDYVRSKTARTVLKTAGLAAFAALGIRDMRHDDTWQKTVATVRGTGTPPWKLTDQTFDGSRASQAASDGTQASDAPAGEGTGTQTTPSTVAPDGMDRTTQVAALAGAGLVVVGSSVLTVVVEKKVFHRNEARAARGVRLPHTRSALLFGALTALVAVPDVWHSRAAESAQR